MKRVLRRDKAEGGDNRVDEGAGDDSELMVMIEIMMVVVVVAVTPHILGILCNSQSLKGRHNPFKEGSATWPSRAVEMQAVCRSGREGGGRAHRGRLGEQGWPPSLLGSLRKILCQARRAQPFVMKT